MKKVGIILLVLGALLAGLALYLQPKAFILNGYASRMVCTCHFVQGRDLESIQSQDLGYSFFKYASIHIDEAAKTVSSSLFGLSPKTSVFSEGLGCRLIKDKDDYEVDFYPPKVIDTFQWEVALDNQISKDLDDLFYDTVGKNDKQTRAALIIKNGKLIYESYAEGFNKDTPQLGWSMTKSVTSTVLGRLIAEGRLSLDQIGLIDKAFHQDVSVDDLLDMRAGLLWEEDYADVSSATEMLFNSDDMVDYASRLPRDPAMVDSFEYSSGVSNLLVGLWYGQFGSKAEAMQYVYSTLFEPLGMASAFIETDEAGHYVGSSYMYASARDWAKYGMLYLDGGKWQGRQVLDSAWVAHTFISDPASHGRYGTQWWHNDDGHLNDAPRDLIYADGYQGQRIYVIPSYDMVVVRLGLRNLDFNNMLKHIIELTSKK